jgi:hemerythrin superfamily protein
VLRGITVNTTSDIYTKLKNDHESVAHVLQRLLEMKTGATNTGPRQRLFSELKHSLIQHSEAENEVFYAPLREHSDTRDLIRDGQAEHQRIESLLNELDGIEKDDAQWGAQLHTLKGIIEHHVHEEEEKVFPKARNIFTAQQAKELGQQFAQAKARQTLTTAKSTVANTTAEASAKVHETGQNIAQEAQRLTAAAQEKGRSILHDQQHFFASQLGGVAAALHKTAQQLGEDEQGGMAQYVDQAATGLERFAHGLQERDLSSLLHQVEDFARRQPVAFIGSAALLGFLAARFLKSSAERRHFSSHPSSPPQGGTVGSYTDTMAPSPGSVKSEATPAYGATASVSEYEGRGTTKPYRGN